MGRTIIVTRHAGAVTLLRELGVAGQVVETLAPEAIAALTPADRVYGPLPVRLIAALTARGVPYHAIDMGLDAAQRGRELSPDAMRASGAAVLRYAAYPVSDVPDGLAPPRPPLRRRDRLGNATKRVLTWLRGLGLTLAAAIALHVAKVVVDAVWDTTKPWVTDPRGAAERAGRILAGGVDWGALRPALIEGGIALLSLVGAVALARWLAGRVLHTTFRPLPIEPRRVLIQGLSRLRDPALAEPFRGIDLRFGGLGRKGLDAARAELAGRLSAAPDDPDLRAALDQVARVPRVAWQQNLRAILSHASCLQRVYVIATTESEDGGGEAQARAFCALAGDILRRSGFGQVTVDLAPGKPIDYESHDQVLGAITGAMRAARARDRDLREADIAIDGTAGTKVFSIAAAVATINSRALLTYVNNEGETLVYDGRMSLVEAQV